MMLGPYGNPDRNECLQIIARAADAGINFIDTADRYSLGVSEQLVGEAVKGSRDRFVLATKFTIPMSEDDPNMRGHSRKWIMRSVEDSLRRLGTDYIDLYQAHRPDADTDLDELLGVLSDLVHQGKIRAIGTSTFPAHMIVESQWVAERRGRERVRCEQPPYSILARGIEADVLPVCQRYGMGVITWSPLGGGWLSGRFRRGMQPPDRPRVATNPGRFDFSLPANQRKFDIVEQLERVAQAADLTLPQLAVGFVLEHPAVTSAIIGPRTVEQLESLLGAGALRLDEGTLDEIDAIVAPGTTLNQADSGYMPPSLSEPRLRRR
jgi:aryl-alcohol dehydrogenase-like predicted oxidoreductase